MIDIHNHILPGLDDGAKDIDESLTLAQAAIAEGITDIIATPHHMTSRYMNDRDTVITQVNALNEQLVTAGLSLTIHPGQEIRIHGGLREALKQDKLLTLNQTGRYLLIEFPDDQIPRYAKQLFFDLETEGYCPVIAHPERNQVFLKEPERLYTFVRSGALTQVTAASITGVFGRKIKQFSETLLEHNLVHLIASDAHHVHRRGFHLNEAYRAVEKSFGRQLSIQLKENATYLLKGETLSLEEPSLPKEKRFFGLF